MKKIALLAVVLFAASSSKADGGMWPVESIPSSIIKKLQADGAGALLDGSMLKKQKAVVIFGRGCTGSFISNNGLILTNHHCAADYLKQLSADAKNILRDGFVANTREQEIPVPGLSVKILHKVVDVTPEADSLRKLLANNNPMFITKRIITVLQKKYFLKTDFECEIDNEQTTGKTKLYAYEVLNDVRLVAAPSMQLGRFGGNADNFEWERYQLDFSLFRAYSSSEGKGVEYNANNKPFVPSSWFALSAKKVKKGMPLYTVGYPGSTSRYVTSEQVKTFVANADSITATVRNRHLAFYADPLPLNTSAERDLSEKIFSYANAAKYSEGRFEGYRRCNLYGMLRGDEAKLPASQKMLVDKINRFAIEMRPIVSTHTTLIETMFKGTSVLIPGMRAGQISKSWKDTAARAKAIANLVKWYDEYAATTDFGKERAHFESQLANLSHAPLLSKSAVISRIATLSSERLRSYCDSVFEHSIFTSPKRLSAFAASGTEQQLNNDPIFILANETYDFAVELKKLANPWQDSVRVYSKKLWDERRKAGIETAPDANFTMRLSVGVAADAPTYGGATKPMATTFADMARVNGKKPTYNVDRGLLDRIASDKKLAKQTLCFASTNDITGGNSGSPVLDADGNIIGLAFDGNFESLLGDVRYLPQYNRAVNVSMQAVVEFMKVVAPSANVVTELQ